VSGDLERLLRRALPPVDPPEDLSTRVRSKLLSISEAAAEELEGWELAAMRDPRNWVRPALAVVGGSLAGAGLLVLGVKRHRRTPQPLKDASAGAGDPGSPAESS
jgi:hypothetical protein